MDGAVRIVRICACPNQYQTFKPTIPHPNRQTQKPEKQDQEPDGDNFHVMKTVFAEMQQTTKRGDRD